MGATQEQWERLAMAQAMDRDARGQLEAAEREAAARLQPLRSVAVMAAKELEEATRHLKDSAMTGLLEEGEVCTLPGIRLQKVKRLEYDEVEAVTWAAHWAAHDLLSIKRGEVLKRARESPDRFPFVKWVEEPVVAVSSDLVAAKRLAKEGRATEEDMLPEGLRAR